ncbi:MAG: PD40 domain-containing protein [Verrucomicrobiales bacterium]|nr:PD40 domain-containing protein [Verrucomicrobiales bacterium]
MLDLDTRQVVLHIEDTGGIVYAVAFSPDGRWIATGGTDPTVRIWDAKTGRLVRRLSSHESNIFCLLFSRDGRQLASGGADHTVRLWPVESLI